jgi:hypothetical protein
MSSPPIQRTTVQSPRVAPALQVSAVEGEGTVDLFKRERVEAVRNAFRRQAFQEGITPRNLTTRACRQSSMPHRAAQRNLLP